MHNIPLFFLWITQGTLNWGFLDASYHIHLIISGYMYSYKWCVDIITHHPAPEYTICLEYVSGERKVCGRYIQCQDSVHHHLHEHH